MKELQSALAAALAGEVRFDAGARAAYACDASNYRQVPIGVVLPRSAEDVAAALAACRANGAPVLARGGGTSLCGQSVNVAVVIDCSKYMNRVLAIDPAARSALVEPGVVCDELRGEAERHGLTFGPDPATHSRCTLGGMIGNNSCGAHSVMAGKTVENIEALEVLTYDGARFWCGPTDDAEYRRILALGSRQSEIYRGLKLLADSYGELIRAGFPRIKRRVSGYNLDQLLPENGFNVARALVGSEGTCALTLQAKAQAGEEPRAPGAPRAGLPGRVPAGDAVPEVLAAGPIACEGLDEPIIGGLRERRLKLDDLAAPARGQGLADDRVRRRHGRGGDPEGQGPARPGRHRPRRDGPPVGDSRDRRLGDLAQSQGHARPGPDRRLGGRGGGSAAPRATTCASSSGSWTATATGRRSTATSATAASTRASPSSCARRRASRAGARSSPRRRRWW